MFDMITGFIVLIAVALSFAWVLRRQDCLDLFWVFVIAVFVLVSAASWFSLTVLWI